MRFRVAWRFRAVRGGSHVLYRDGSSPGIDGRVLLEYARTLQLRYKDTALLCIDVGRGGNRRDCVVGGHADV